MYVHCTTGVNFKNSQIKQFLSINVGKIKSKSKIFLFSSFLFWASTLIIRHRIPNRVRDKVRKKAWMLLRTVNNTVYKVFFCLFKSVHSAFLSSQENYRVLLQLTLWSTVCIGLKNLHIFWQCTVHSSSTFQGLWGLKVCLVQAEKFANKIMAWTPHTLTHTCSFKEAGNRVDSYIL